MPLRETQRFTNWQLVISQSDYSQVMDAWDGMNRASNIAGNTEGLRWLPVPSFGRDQGYRISTLGKGKMTRINISDVVIFEGWLMLKCQHIHVLLHCIWWTTFGTSQFRNLTKILYVNSMKELLSLRSLDAQIGVYSNEM